MVRRWVFLLALLLGGTGAFAHAWYDSRCCSDRDCWPAAKVELMPNGDRVVTATNGIVVVIKPDFSRVLPSQDSDYHVCYYFTWRGEPIPRCLYVPGAA